MMATIIKTIRTILNELDRPKSIFGFCWPLVRWFLFNQLISLSLWKGDAGAIIGRQGKNIQMLRSKFKTVIQVPVSIIVVDRFLIENIALIFILTGSNWTRKNFNNCRWAWTVLGLFNRCLGNDGGKSEITPRCKWAACSCPYVSSRCYYRKRWRTCQRIEVKMRRINFKAIVSMYLFL